MESSTPSNQNPVPTAVLQSSQPPQSNQPATTNSKFSIDEALRFGWNTALKNLGFFIAIFVVALLVSFIPNFLANLLSKNIPILSLILFLLTWVLNVVISIGIVKITLKFVDSIKPEISDLFNAYNLFLNYILGSILYGLIVLAGFVLLIVPGIIWAIKFQFFSYLIIDKGLGPMDSLKQSSQITKGVKWNLFIFGLVLGVVNILGFLALGIGLLVTIPLTMVAQAYVYRKLLSQTPGI